MHLCSNNYFVLDIVSIQLELEITKKIIKLKRSKKNNEIKIRTRNSHRIDVFQWKES